MKEVDILKDILEYRISNQVFYNESLVYNRNPSVRQLFSQMRDDEMRDIVRLQEKIERLQSKPYIVSKIFPSRKKN